MNEETRGVGASARAGGEAPVIGSDSADGSGLRFLELVPDFVCVCLDHHIVFINRAGLGLLGTDDRASLVGEPFVRLLSGDYAELGDEFLDVMADETEAVPVKFRGADGRVLDMELTVSRGDGVMDGAILVFGRDVTETVRLSDAVMRSEARHRKMVKNARELICVCEDDHISFINPAGARMLQVKDADGLIGRRFSDFVGATYRDVFRPDFVQDLIGEAMPLPIKLVAANGAVRDVEVLVSAVDETGGARYMIEARDITDTNRAVMALRESIENLETRVAERTRELTEEVAMRRKAEEQLRYSATHDSLTGLPNRRLFMDRLDVALADARRRGSEVAVMFLDLDGFKPINDQMGHDAGDALLEGVAGRFLGCVRETDTVARIGGDEFIILLTGLRGTNDAILVAEKVLDSLAAPFDLEGGRASVGTSIGVALYPTHAADADALLRAADAAMYEVKNSGKRNYRVASLEASGQGDVARRA